MKKISLNVIVLFLVTFMTVQAQTVPELIEKATVAEQAGQTNEAAGYWSKAGFEAWGNNDLENAIIYLKKSIDYNQEIGNINGVSRANNSIGMIYTDLEKYQTSIDYFRKSKLGRVKLNDKRGVVSDQINIALAQKNANQAAASTKTLEEALDLAKELNDIRLLKTCYSSLAENYEAMGDTEKSFEYFNIYSSLDKKIQKEEMAKNKKESQEKVIEYSQLASQANRDKAKTEEELVLTCSELEASELLNKAKEAEISLLAKENELKESQIKQKELREEKTQLYMTIMVGGIALVGLVALLMIRAYLLKRRTTQKLEIQNAQILEQQQRIESSITYGKRIQDAILPQVDKIKSFFDDAFIFFKPRDVVSGDFYWFIQLDEQKALIAAVDCTGHGVPGAFMSMIGAETLTRIVKVNKITSPEKILDELNDSIREDLKQDQIENRDGMDMSICLIDKQAKTLSYAGAKNPLVYVQDNELQEIKGDKMPIGGRTVGSEGSFTLHTIAIDKSTDVYLYSDGYPDQFGGVDGKKFMSKKFKELLNDIHPNTYVEQEETLDKRLSAWQGTGRQIDDILVIGFKIN